MASAVDTAGVDRDTAGGAGASAPRRSRLHIFGVPVDAVTADEARLRAAALLADRRSDASAVILTPNPELIMRARQDAELLAAARSAALALPDGVGVVWAARRLGHPCPTRLPGIEFMDTLLALAAASSRPVFFLGARPQVVTRAAEQARLRHPGLRIAGTADGYFGPSEEAGVVARVASSGAELLLVGMGVPAQERFLYRHRRELGAVALAMAVGGSFDVLSGAMRRAPPAVRRLGLEWLWRLCSQPGRWRRQLALPRFAWAVLRAPEAARRMSG